MAYIPYGYRINGGEAVIDSAQAENILLFLNAYLSGFSIEAAGDAACIPLSPQALKKILLDSLYTGTDYYPAIISESLHKKAVQAWKTRTHSGNKVCKKPVSVRRRFRLKLSPSADLPDRPADRLQFLYSLIIPSRQGKTVLSRQEVQLVQERLTEIIKKKEEKRSSHGH